MKDTATVSYTKDKGKYQFLKASNTDDQNLLMSQFTFDFVCIIYWENNAGLFFLPGWLLATENLGELRKIFILLKGR